MFVRCKMRRMDGKEHRYWSVVENVRVRGGRVVQRQVLYLGEINDSQPRRGAARLRCCSFSFEEALVDAGLPLRHWNDGSVCPML